MKKASLNMPPKSICWETEWSSIGSAVVFVSLLEQMCVCVVWLSKECACVCVCAQVSLKMTALTPPQPLPNGLRKERICGAFGGLSREKNEAS